MRDKIENVQIGDEQEQVSENESEVESTSEQDVRAKKKKPGIVYLSSIPKFMTAAYLRELLSNFGEIGRIYLQEDTRDGNAGKKKGKKSHFREYAEGWVEFKSKRIAKEVARVLNNTQIGGRKKSKFYDSIWTIKYLPRFKWTHLSERLAYEKAVHKQRMRAEITQAKKEADYFSLNVDKSERIKKKKSKEETADKSDLPPVEIRQRETEDQILLKKKKKSDKNNGSLGSDDNRDDFLKNLFS